MIMCAVYGCVRYEPSLLNDLQIRYIAIMYRYGPFHTIEEIKELVEQSDYDDDVLKYYNYFRGTVDLEDVKFFQKAEVYDQRIKDYIQKHLPVNNSDDSLFIDNFDDPLPLQIIDTKSEYQSALSERIYRLLERDWQSMGLFRVWYEDFYKNEICAEQLKRYADLIAQITCIYSSKVLERVRETSSTFYIKFVDMSKIPPELLLAIAYKESRFFPGSFRAEIYQDKIQAVSLGLCHILVDADTLDLDFADIGDQKVDMRTFELIGYYYLGNDYAQKNVFDEIDLIQLRGNILVCLIQLSLIYEKLRLSGVIY